MEEFLNTKELLNAMQSRLVVAERELKAGRGMLDLVLKQVCTIDTTTT